MPAKRLEFIKGPLDAANDTSAGAFTDPITGQLVPGGGLILGDYFDLTDAEALKNCQFTIQGPSSGAVPLYGGRYRRVRLDPGATAANVSRGTAAYLVLNSPISRIVVTTVGSGQTPGTYIVNASSGTAQAIVVVGTDGTISYAYLSPTSPGGLYTSVPTFTVPSGGTPGTIVAQMGISSYVVTDYAHAFDLGLGRGVFLNAVTPGNYTFIQEEGLATFLGAGTITNSGANAIVRPVASSTPGSFNQITITNLLPSDFGVSVDAAVASSFFRGYLKLTTFQP